MGKLRLSGWGLMTLWCCGSALLLVSCSQSTVLERDFGQAWRYNQEIQIVNPQAGWTARPTTGLSPEAGRKIMESYNKGFERKEESQKTPPASIVELGGK